MVINCNKIESKINQNFKKIDFIILLSIFKLNFIFSSPVLNKLLVFIC